MDDGQTVPKIASTATAAFHHRRSNERDSIRRVVRCMINNSNKTPDISDQCTLCHFNEILQLFITKYEVFFSKDLVIKIRLLPP
jgi:hypothetical protein